MFLDHLGFWTLGLSSHFLSLFYLVLAVTGPMLLELVFYWTLILSLMLMDLSIFVIDYWSQVYSILAFLYCYVPVILGRRSLAMF